MALQKAIGSIPTQVRFIGIDFNQQSIIDILSQAGFDNTRPACFVWEGVTNYLTPDGVDGVLREIGQAAVGSILVFTYVHRGVLERPELFFGAEQLMSRLHSYGEPWTFGLYPENLAGFLAARGLRPMTDLSVEEVWQHTGRAAADTRGYEFYRLAAARVQGSE